MKHLLVTGTILACLAACSVNGQLIREEGTIQYIPVEGGFYGIVSSNGRRYDPVNLDPEFRQDALKVRFSGRVLKDRASFHMWGAVFEIQSISKQDE